VLSVTIGPFPQRGQRPPPEPKVSRVILYLIKVSIVGQ